MLVSATADNSPRQENHAAHDHETSGTNIEQSVRGEVKAFYIPAVRGRQTSPTFFRDSCS